MWDEAMLSCMYALQWCHLVRCTLDDVEKGARGCVFAFSADADRNVASATQVPFALFFFFLSLLVVHCLLAHIHTNKQTKKKK